MKYRVDIDVRRVPLPIACDVWRVERYCPDTPVAGKNHETVDEALMWAAEVIRRAEFGPRLGDGLRDLLASFPAGRERG